MLAGQPSEPAVENAGKKISSKHVTVDKTELLSFKIRGRKVCKKSQKNLTIQIFFVTLQSLNRDEMHPTS